MTSKNLFVWIWLPQHKEPTIMGRLRFDAQGYSFVYGKNYLSNPHAISLDPQILPLQSMRFGPQKNLFYSLRDASPDAWGRRVLLYRQGFSSNSDTNLISELDYLLQGSDARIGALHFQNTSEDYQALPVQRASLQELLEASEAILKGENLSASWLDAIQHGTSIGGARPKVTLEYHQAPWIAKFSTQTDTFPVVRQEALGMELARRLNIHTAENQLTQVLKKDVLLIRRFDRDNQGLHRHMISGLTALQLDEMEARYASYPQLAEFIWKYGREPKKQCEELYRRMVFNILIGNTDDHARNHAFFWNGQEAELTPAYDVSILSRIGEEASQAMIIGDQGTFSSRSNALSKCPSFGLSIARASNIFDEFIESIHHHWKEACEVAHLTENEQNNLMGRAVLSPMVMKR